MEKRTYWMLGLGLMVWEAIASVGSIVALADGSDYAFHPDFSCLEVYDRKVEVGGWEAGLRLFLVTDGATESVLNVNSGTTQYQGHYVWQTNKCVSGFGTYTSSKRNRSFGWIWRNDTGRELTVEGMAAKFGQWGARNRLPDQLAFDCKVSSAYIDPRDSDGWKAHRDDVFTTPYTNNAPDAHFPCFEEKSLKVRPGRIHPDDYFAVRFTDSCPASGNNAHLGIADFQLKFTAKGKGLTVLFR